MSRSPYGERGLKSCGRRGLYGFCCRSPYGERGLKCPSHSSQLSSRTSRRSPYGERGLKFLRCVFLVAFVVGRSPYGERGLKCIHRTGQYSPPVGRSPYGERGLKYIPTPAIPIFTRSLSLRRAWIEIFALCVLGCFRGGSLSLRRAWIEMSFAALSPSPASCRSPYGERGLKYLLQRQRHRISSVALLTESVD